jgi:hypothetical protein
VSFFSQFKKTRKIYRFICTEGLSPKKSTWRNTAMELTYETIEKFMQEYYDYFNMYSQNFDPYQKMDKFWTEDFKLTAYFHRKDKPSPIKLRNGIEFNRDIVTQVHRMPNESIIPLDIIIDDENKKVAVLLRIQTEVQATGKQHDFTGIAIYQLCLDKDDVIKIKSIDLCVDNPEGFSDNYGPIKSLE